ncbi:MAG TPA: ankyrin repeat domain-containing protein [Anaerohalosphaeraceae bacterium]|nr:ankyrin repeat domain-containing protein [Anaerohalosphaeraceae bacterium]HRT24830.1 ankyrin repeat domain-containing protein [Anaerohalosphaeraceae bacterium]
MRKRAAYVYLVLFVITLGSIVFFVVKMQNNLFYEIKNLRIEKVERILKKGHDINQTQKGLNALHYIIRIKFNNEIKDDKINDIFILLIDYGINVDKVNKFGFAPLHEAISFGQYDLAEILIKKGANVNIKGLNGIQPIHLAAGLGQIETLKLLLENGACINAKDEESATPLHEAIVSGKIDVVRYLVEQGADMEAKDNMGRTPIDMAIFFKEEEITKYLTTKLRENGELNKRVRNFPD